MMPHNKFSDQRELSGLNNSAPSGRREREELWRWTQQTVLPVIIYYLQSEFTLYVHKKHGIFCLRILYFANDIFLYMFFFFIIILLNFLGNVVVFADNKNSDPADRSYSLISSLFRHSWVGFAFENKQNAQTNLPLSYVDFKGATRSLHFFVDSGAPCGQK